MGRLLDKIRELISGLIPIAIIGALLFGGYHLYQKGTFRRGIGPAVSSVLHKIPYFGSRFKHYKGSSSFAINTPRKHTKRSKGRHHVRKHHVKKHRRNRR
jgi:hypothetical protein